MVGDGDGRSALHGGRGERKGPHGASAWTCRTLWPMEFLAFAVGGSALLAIGAMVFAAFRDDDH